MPTSFVKQATNTTVYSILLAVCSAHFINDLLQIVLISNFPDFRDNYQLSFAQIGIITLAFQLTSSIFQPVVGNFTDKHPMPYSFMIGMSSTLAGIIYLSFANNYHSILLAAVLIGLGSSIFHPESSKLCFYAAGGRRGLAQSIFQIGGNIGSALGPLLVTLIVLHKSQRNIGYFGIFAVVGICILFYVGRWYSKFLRAHRREVKGAQHMELEYPMKKVVTTLLILLLLIFSKYFYIASINSFLQLYLIDKFHFTTQESQTYLFAYLFAVALGTLLGGPLGDKYGRKYVIWFSILGVAPFTLILPYASPGWILFLLVMIGIILSSAFAAILVYAQELLPGRTGMISGFFYGFAFGMGGIGAAVLGGLADAYSLEVVFKWCAFLPLLGIFTVFIPNLKHTNNSELVEENSK